MTFPAPGGTKTNIATPKYEGYLEPAAIADAIVYITENNAKNVWVRDLVVLPLGILRLRASIRGFDGAPDTHAASLTDRLLVLTPLPGAASRAAHESCTECLAARPGFAAQPAPGVSHWAFFSAGIFTKWPSTRTHQDQWPSNVS